MMDLAPGSPSRRKRHQEMLAIAAVVVVLSFMLQLVPGDQVAFRWLLLHPLPPTCFTRHFLHISCPGCGLTRSFVLLAHGDFAASFRMHHLGWLLALAVLLQFPYRIASLWRTDRHLLSFRARQVIAYTLIFLLIANWGVEQVLHP